MIIGCIVLFLFFVFMYLFSMYDWQEIEDEKISKEALHQKIVDAEKLDKGTAFEMQISQLISEKIQGAVVLNNCILNKKGKDGKDIYMDGTVASKEFDAICLCKYGCFVVEAKNFSQAFVSGNFNDKTWITSYSKNKVYSVYSPYKQVTEGVITLKKYFPDMNFKKFVVYPDSTKISDNLEKSGEVMTLQQFRFKLNEMMEQKASVTKETIRLMKDVLIEENDRARRMHGDKEHLEYVKKCREAASSATA